MRMADARLHALAEMVGGDAATRAALARAAKVGQRIGLVGPALLLYALSAAEAVRRGMDAAALQARLAADLAWARRPAGVMPS